MLEKELQKLRVKGIKNFFETRGNQVTVEPKSVDEYVTTLTKGDDTNKYLLKCIPYDNYNEYKALVCMYAVVTTSLVDSNNTLIEFERLGECVNYLGMKKGIEVHEGGSWGDTVEVEPNNFKHVFKQVEVSI